MKDEPQPVVQKGDKRYAEAMSLFDNGLYKEAYEKVEDIIAEPDYCDRARLAAALCCLEIAHRAVVEGLRKFPYHPVLLNDQERIIGSKRMLNELEWRDVPCGIQRGSRS
ncbi:MAG: hypothetical protein J7639_09550 [Paenibacillaceae bacterium]|nr:hypothetical protein [Paenibacillaceae bacterium]